MSTSPFETGKPPEEPDPAGNHGWGEPLPTDPDSGDLEPVQERPEPDP